MNDPQPNPNQFNRNLGFISRVEHEHLQQSTVAIAGVGGDGGELAVTLAQLGIGNFRLADPEVFEIDNLNRQAGATFDTLGKNKAEVIASMIFAVNPQAQVAVFIEGITPGNVQTFVVGADLVVDETEFTKHELGVMLARAARKEKLPVLMTLNIGFGAYTTSFAPDGKKFEEYLGLDPNADLDEIAKANVPLYRWVPHIPSYADTNIFKAIEDRDIPTPTVSPGVKMAAAYASVQALAHLLQQISPERQHWICYAPHGTSIDAIDGRINVRFPRAHFFASFAVAALRTKLGKNPRAGY